MERFKIRQHSEFQAFCTTTIEDIYSVWTSHSVCHDADLSVGDVHVKNCGFARLEENYYG